MQTQRFINKILQKFNLPEEDSVLTDIHIRVNQDTGELLAFDDNEVEITRCVEEEWIDSKNENFYNDVTSEFRKLLQNMEEDIEKASILRPFSFVLEDEEGEHIAELYVSDGDMAIIGGDLMGNLDEELDLFMSNLLEKE